ncbi:Rv3654c family TadE-like protein [Ornithinimicrobium kibberense]|uniref:Rv3654c family TadE-like protein n=1 Tax=Ornithinimicrobium kibberense TaxID=282060 RepID=A0ABV5V169_9MICO|nr:Rv3654c family TadE-like protein [Ornithinimicrobium kibberense]
MSRRYGKDLRLVHRDRGSGTVLAVGLVSVLATLLLAGAMVAAVAVAGQRARTAADLAALAAVAESSTGASQEPACKVARDVALRNGADLVRCRTTLGDAGRPRAEVVVRTTAGGRWTVTRRAAAGAVPGPSAVQVEPAAVLGPGGP